MTNKLTGREALAYMATGGWFDYDGIQYSVAPDCKLFGYDEVDGLFVSRNNVIDIMREGITPCPDPTVKVNEYAQDRCRVVEAPVYPTLEEERVAMVCFFEKWFQRKEQP